VLQPLGPGDAGGTGHHSPEIADLVAALSDAAHSLGSRLHPRSAVNLAEFVRVMNCYRKVRFL
jgi:hypothetical protein